MSKRNLQIMAIVAACWFFLALLASGQDPVKVAAAKYCYTINTVVETIPAPSPDGPVDDVCGTCNGKGWVGDGVTRNTCPTCDGSGKKKKTRTISTVAGWPPRNFGMKPMVSTNTNEAGWLDRGLRYGSKPTVSVYSIDNCQACDRLKIEEKPKLPKLIGGHRFESYKVGRNQDLGGFSFPVVAIRQPGMNPVVIDSSKSRITAQQIASILSELKKKDVQ